MKYFCGFSLFSMVTCLAWGLAGFLGTGCSSAAPLSSMELGVLDYPAVSRGGTSAVKLSGEWEFYWNMLLSPGDFRDAGKAAEYMRLPGVWNGYRRENGRLGGTGFATFRMHLLLKEEGEYGFKLGDMETAYRIFVDGREILEMGKVGTTPQTSSPSWERTETYLPLDPGEREVILHVSNFHHRKGGPERPIWFGTGESIRRLIRNRAAWEAFLIGALFIIGLYHFILFAQRKRELSALFLGVFCILMVLRTLFSGEKLFIRIFPWIPWGFAVTFEYINLFLLLPVIAEFYLRLFPGEVSPPAVRGVQIVSGALIVVTVAAPVRIFSYLVYPYDALFILFGGYVLYILVKNTRKWRNGSGVLLIGSLLLLAAGINDVIWTVLPNAPIRLIPSALPLGLFVFILAHSAVLARRFTAALTTAEELTLGLEAKVKERTAELEIEKDKLFQISRIDTLTGLFNRRHLLEILEIEITRKTRYGGTFSIMIFDLDHFKKVNDTYGHPEGDRVLVRFAESLQAELRDSDVCGRFGGEEFLVILPQADVESGVAVAEKIRKSFGRHLFTAGEEDFRVTCSAGVAEHQRGEDSKTIIKRADIGLYQAKSMGRNLVRTG